MARERVSVSHRHSREPGRIHWFFLGVFVVVCLGLGIWGHEIYYLAMNRDHTAWDSVYRTLQAFALGSTLDPGPKNWQLEICRFLSPVTAAYGIVLSVMSILGDRARLFRKRGHIVICGLGLKGFELAKAFIKQREKVIVIETKETGEHLGTCRKLGAVVLNGDAREPVLLRKARVEKAKFVIATCGNDATNLQIGASVKDVANPDRRSYHPLRCFLHITDLPSATSLHAFGLTPNVTSGCSILTWNFYENSARSIMAGSPLDWQPIAPHDPRSVHLVIIGFDHMGQALALHALKMGHFANLRKPCLMVVDPDLDGKRNAFLASYPQANNVGDINFRDEGWDSPQIRGELATLAMESGVLLTIAVCLEDHTSALRCAMTLPTELSERQIPVWVQLSGETTLPRILSAASNGANLRSIGDTTSGCATVLFYGESMEMLARAFHEAYREEAGARGPSAEVNTSLAEWWELPEGLRDSNRQQADHIPVKLRAIGCEAVPLDGQMSPFVFTAGEIELLAKIEHVRWCAERWLAGWRLGPSDKPNRISPHLVPWEEVPNDIREYDRSSVRAIPKILARTGQGIRRRP